jgi:uncharacterized protein YxeA
MNKHRKDFLIKEVGMPKRIVLILILAKKFPQIARRTEIAHYAFSNALVYLEKHYEKVGNDEYEKSMSKLRHPAYNKRGTRKNVI